jgi:hypothetical protein
MNRYRSAAIGLDLEEQVRSQHKSQVRILPAEVSINKGVNIVEDFRHLPRNVDEGISGIFRVGATKVGDEKTDEIDIFIYRHLLNWSKISCTASDCSSRRKS